MALARPGSPPDRVMAAGAINQRGLVGLTTGGGAIGVVPPPGTKPGGGGVVVVEKLSIDCALVEYVTCPLAEIQATLFLFGSVSRATFPVLAIRYSAWPSTNLSFVTHSSPGLLTRSSTTVPRTPRVPWGVLTW